MKTIPLSQNKYTLVDETDYPSLMLFKWYAKESSSGWYVVRMEQINRHSMRSCKKPTKRKRRTLRMHNVLMKPTGMLVVHHKDGNGLNNQRSNLELCTPRENHAYAVEAKREEAPF